MHHDESTRDDAEDSEEVAPARTGDVLGLGGIAVPKDAPKREADRDDDTEGRGHMGVLDEADDEPRTKTAFRPSSGATGIDMGAGGSGTDID